MNCNRAFLLLLALLASTPVPLSAQVASSKLLRRPSHASETRALARRT